MGRKRGRGGNEVKIGKGGGNKAQGGKGKSNNNRNNHNSSQPRPGFIRPVGEKENNTGKEKQVETRKDAPKENATIEETVSDDETDSYIDK